MAILDAVKAALRVSSATIAYDAEVTGLIEAALADLKLAGVTAEKAVDTDSLVQRAIICYAKGHFGFGNPDADRLLRSYDLLKAHLTLSRDYIGYTITFTVAAAGVPVAGATVEFDDNTILTSAAGQAIFRGVRADNQLDYTVTADGYDVAEGTIDVAADQAVAVALAVG